MKVEGFVNYSRILVLIAALNEQQGIGFTLSELKEALDKPILLVVDGNSTDKTADIARVMGAKVLSQRGRGKGDAIGQAVTHVNDGVKYVVFVDADYTYPAEYLPEMIKILEENPRVGMVCGNRFKDGLNLGRLHDLLYFGNRLLAFAHNFLNGVELNDPLTGLRVLRSEILRGWKPKSKGFDIEVELNHQVERKGFGIVEIPIEYRPRLGEKKLRLEHGLTILKRILVETLN
jgi:glycosyltransferase involved in cell wall biosynthesis